MATPVSLDIVNDPLFRVYAFYSSILVLKIMAMAILTGRQRFKHKAFINPEDTKRFPNLKTKTNDDVERVRRAHLNDLENITLFFFIGFIYILTNPSVAWATLLFRAYTIARIVHTIVYAVVVVPQPARGMSWGVGYLITGYMAVKSILYFA